MLLRAASAAENPVDTTEVLADGKPHRVPEAESHGPAVLPREVCGPGTRLRKAQVSPSHLCDPDL